MDVVFTSFAKKKEVESIMLYDLKSDHSNSRVPEFAQKLLLEFIPSPNATSHAETE